MPNISTAALWALAFEFMSPNERTSALQQLVLGMRVTAARVMSRGIPKESRKAGACGEPHPSLGLRYLPVAFSEVPVYSGKSWPLSYFPEVVIPLDASNWVTKHGLDIVTNLTIRARHKPQQL